MIKMKRILWGLIVALTLIAAVFIFSSARENLSLPQPEDITGKEASPLLPEKGEDNKPAAKGSRDLKLTGPVWVKE